MAKKQVRVLIADDMLANIVSTRQLLNSVAKESRDEVEFVIDTASDYDSTKAKLEQNQYDLMIADLMIGGYKIDGSRDITALLKEHYEGSRGEFPPHIFINSLDPQESKKAIAETDLQPKLEVMNSQIAVMDYLERRWIEVGAGNLPQTTALATYFDKEFGTNYMDRIREGMGLKPPPAKKQITPAAEPTQPPLRVLVVNDEEYSALAWMQTLRLLKEEGNSARNISIVVSTSRKDALQKIKSQKYDCVIFDYFMAAQSNGISAKDFVEEIEKVAPSLRPSHVFVLSKEFLYSQTLAEDCKQMTHPRIVAMHSDEMAQMRAKLTNVPKTTSFAEYFDKEFGTQYMVRIRKGMGLEATPAPAKKQITREAQPSQAALKVLVVNDDKKTLFLLQNTIENLHKQGKSKRSLLVETDTCVKEAMQKIKSQKYDWVISDYELQDEDFDDLVQEINKIEGSNKPSFLFVLSADFEKSQRAATQNRHMTDPSVIAMNMDELKWMKEGKEEKLKTVPESIDFAQQWDNTMGDDYSPPLFELKKRKELEQASDPQKAYAAFKESVLTKEEIVRFLDASKLEGLYPKLKDSPNNSFAHASPTEKTVGLPATGYLAFNEKGVEALGKEGKKAILVTQDYKLSDISQLGNIAAVMYCGEGFDHLKSLTDNFGIRALDINNYTLGGATGEESLFLLMKNDEDATAGEHQEFTANHPLSIDNDGTIYPELREIDQFKEMPPVTQQFLDWFEEARVKNDGLGVNINADNASQLEAGILAGGEALGLARSENMLLSGDAPERFKQEILSKEKTGRSAFIQHHLRVNLEEMFEVANKHQLPSMGIRLFDPSVKDILNERELLELTQKVGEENLSGVQLGLKRPHLYDANIRAILEAANNTHYEGKVEIIVPHLKTADEFVAVKEQIKDIAEEMEVPMPQVVPMVETLEIFADIPRVVKMAQKRYYGTNDLTQKITGIESRTSKDATDYFIDHPDERMTVDPKSPFVALTKTVMEMIARMEAQSRNLNPTSKGCICGAQAIDPETINLLHRENIGNISVPAMHARAAIAYAGKAAAMYPELVKSEMLDAYGASSAVSAGMARL